MRWPPLLYQLHQATVVDYICCAKPSNARSFGDIRLLLFAAQYEKDDARSAVELLAKAFQPMMTLFILYYLDTRTSREALMPSWMVLFGIVYDENGFSVQSYFPSFQLPLEGSSHLHQDVGWTANAWSVTNEECETMRRAPNQRGTMIGILMRLQSHCRHVLEQLEKWDGYERVTSKMQF